MEINIHINVAAEKPEGILQLKEIIKQIEDGSLEKDMIKDTDISSVKVMVERVR